MHKGLLRSELTYLLTKGYRDICSEIMCACPKNKDGLRKNGKGKSGSPGEIAIITVCVLTPDLNLPFIGKFLHCPALRDHTV